MTTLPLDDQPVTIDDEPTNLNDVKPLVVPENVLKENQAGGGSCAVSMEPLVIRPVCYKLPTARRGTLFRPYNAPGQKRPQSCEIRDSDEEMAHKIRKVENKTDMEGNANIEIETSSYDDWLAKQGLASPHLHKYNLEMKVEDIKSEDNDSNINKGDTDEEVHESGIDIENKLEENIKMSDKFDILTQEVQGMISRGEGEAESEKRKSRLEMILKLLSDEKAETKKIPEKSESASSICKEITEKADKPNSGTQVIKPVKETSQSSGTPKKKPGPKSSKVKKAKSDMSGKREPLICKIKKKNKKMSPRV